MTFKSQTFNHTTPSPHETCQQIRNPRQKGGLLQFRDTRGNILLCNRYTLSEETRREGNGRALSACSYSKCFIRFRVAELELEGKWSYKMLRLFKSVVERQSVWALLHLCEICMRLLPVKVGRMNFWHHAEMKASLTLCLKSKDGFTVVKKVGCWSEEQGIMVCT